MEQMSKVFLVISLISTGLALTSNVRADQDRLRAPAVPLVLHDPYFSIWSKTNDLAESETAHWTGGKHALSAIIWIDKVPFRLLGASPANYSALKQTDLLIAPTQTTASYLGSGVKIGLKFTTPTLPDNLDLLSRPATYVTLDAKSTDGKKHVIKFQFGASAEIATSGSDQVVKQVASKKDKLTTLKVGTTSQPILGRTGDWVRIDWGQLLLSAKSNLVETSDFETKKQNPDGQTSAENVTARIVFRPIEVESDKPQSQWLIVGYDDEFSIQYFKQNLRPYWRCKGDNADSMLKKAASEYSSVTKKCDKFDDELMRDLTNVGGKKYAELSALAYRQCFAGCKLAADPNGQPLLFPKENTSNGCIATSDVIYPMAPEFLLFGSSLSRAMMVPIMDYAASSRWKFPFAPHDLGTYPKANGQAYGGGERSEENQMPVEESANMLILVAALAKVEGNANFAKKYWPTLTKWADYLKAKGFDPENQLCTDDFLGHLAHNVNLSAKAMIGIACYAQLCEMNGDHKSAKSYGDLAKSFANRWMKEADSGDHYRLTFDRPDSWSQKYNLVWDKILGLNLFPDSVRTKEMAYYRKVAKPFGVPLDNRGAGAKLDWSLWTATLTQNPGDFEAIMDPVYRFVNETPQRVGMGDWYDTSNGNHLFMHSRPVVGGVFLQMLYSNSIWTKWAKRDSTIAKGWAPIPEPPKVVNVIPAADTAASTWKYTFESPNSNWFSQAFDDSTWKSGLSGFGTSDTPGVTVRTKWDTKDIWIRRNVDLTADQIKGIEFWMHHDDTAEVYINGVLARRSTGWTSQYEVLDMTSEGRKALRVGKNVIAIHCHQDAGGQYVDLGFVSIKKPGAKKG